MSDKRNIADLLQADKKNFWRDSVVANAPLLIAVFANAIVVLMDVRVYDVIYRLTGAWWKALSASFACAVPFVLWEIAWQYNHTTDNWRKASLVMAGVAFVTSIVLGVADFLNFTGEWTNPLLGSVVILTGVHTVVAFLYYYNDPDVARRRRKAQALATMQDQEMNAEVAKSLLENGKTVLGVIQQLEGQYSPEDVEKVLAILQGRRVDNPRQNATRDTQKPQNQAQFQKVAYAKDAEKLPELKENHPTDGPERK